MIPFQAFLGAPAPAPIPVEPILPAETAEPVIPPAPVPAEEPVSFFGAIGNWIQANPIWTALIILVLILTILFLIIAVRRVRIKNKLGKTGKTTDSLSVSIGNAHHIGLRSSQQDSFAISDISNLQLCKEKGVFAVVADGMGGLSNGAEVSAIVTSSMLRNFNSNGAECPPDAFLLSLVGNANDETNQYLGRDGIGSSGSTVVAAVIKNRRLSWVAVGDSRICLMRNGTLLQLNREHNYGLDLDEKAAMGEITAEEAQKNPQRAALTSYIGMGKLEKIDRNTRSMQLLSKDRVLLMSDGVFGTLSDDEILSVMTDSPYESAAKLEEAVLKKNNPRQDNFTAIILECV